MPERIVMSLLLCGALCVGCADDLPDTEQAAADKIEQLYRDSLYTEAVALADKAIDTFGTSEKLLAKKYKTLLAQEQYTEALTTFDGIIEIVGDHPNVVIDKLRLLRRLERYDEAIGTAQSLYSRYPDETAYVSLEAARVSALRGQKEDALEWLERSVAQGFADYEFLQSEHFRLVQGTNRFDALILQMEKAAGIGLPVQSFSTMLFGGGSYDLNAAAGKVILIDFWATWCAPCVAEHPNLLKLHEEYSDEGFEIVSISADTDRNAVQRFADKHPMPWNVGYSGEGKNDPVIRQYGIESFPTYIVVDRNGIVQYVSGTGGEKLNAALEALLKDQTRT